MDRARLDPFHAAPLPPARPLAPPAEALLPYLRRLDATRIYSNFGPLNAEVSTRIAAMAGYEPAGVVTASSGTVALMAVLRARTGAAQRDAATTGAGASTTERLCLMPAWTFAATPAAALSAGLTPYFLDVDEASWALDPAHVIARARALAPAAIVAVAPFGAPLDWRAWRTVEQETGVPVVLDAAAAFDTVTQAPPGDAPPLILSLHATKALGCGEGGLALTHDTALAVTVQRMLNFGFYTDRITREPGVNGKMSEYHAAVALAALDAWPQRRADWLSVKRMLRQAVNTPQDTSAVSLGPDAAHDHATATFNVLAKDGAEAAQHRLAALRVKTLRWWGPGCAAQDAYRQVRADPLPVTTHLAQRALGLPCFPDMTKHEARRIADALTRLGAGHPVIAEDGVRRAAAG